MAPRANWKGYLRLSLVSCPVALYPAPGRAARGSVAPQKDGLLFCRAGGDISFAVFNREREWTPRRATLLCSPPCRSSAQASFGFGVTLSWVRSFLRSVESPLSA